MSFADSSRPRPPVAVLTETSTSLTSRVQTWTAADSGVQDSVITIPANGTLGTAGIAATVTAATTSSDEVAQGSNADTYAANVAAWLNTGTNLADAGLESAVALHADVTVTYIAGSAANDIVPVTDDPRLSFADVTTGADPSGRYSATYANKPYGTLVQEGQFTYKLTDPDNYDTVAGWTDVTVGIPTITGVVVSGAGIAAANRLYLQADDYESHYAATLDGTGDPVDTGFRYHSGSWHCTFEGVDVETATSEATYPWQVEWLTITVLPEYLTLTGKPKGFQCYIAGGFKVELQVVGGESDAGKWVIVYPAGMLSSGIVDLNSATTQPLFTVPTGYKAVLFPLPLTYRDLSTSVGGTPSFTVGWTADSANIIGDCSLASLITETGRAVSPTQTTGGLNPTIPIGIPGDVLSVAVYEAEGSPLTMTVDVFGYLIPA